MGVQITDKQIAMLAPKAIDPYRKAFANQDALAKYDVSDNALRVCHFLAQVLTETGDLEVKEENLNYSASRLCAVWPRHFPTIEAAAPYAHDPEALGNFIYGKTSIAKQLANTEDGDGYRYRGRGLLQITGRGAYTRYGGALGIALADNPELAFDPEHALAIAAAEWKASGYHGKSCNALADQDDIVSVTYAINGGQNGIDQRKAWLKRTKALWPAAPRPRT